MGTRAGCRSGCCSVTATWCRTPPAGMRIPARAPTSASFGPPVSTTSGACTCPSLVLHPGHPVAVAQQAAEVDLLGHPHAAAEQRHGVGGHVARRADEPVVGAERPAEGLAGGQRRVDRVHLVRLQPDHGHAERRLHGRPVAGGRDLRRGEARQQVALADEPGVGAESPPLAQVEPAGPDAEADGLRAYRPVAGPRPRRGCSRPGRARPFRRARPGRRPAFAQEVRAPRADRPAADHDGVRGVRETRRGHWHEHDAGIN